MFPYAVPAKIADKDREGHRDLLVCEADERHPTKV